MIINGLRVYRAVVSPLKLHLFGSGACCRYWPSCSAYAIDAVTAHGVVRGMMLSLRRVARCHPWGGSGWDPVPPPGGRRPAWTTSPDRSFLGNPATDGPPQNGVGVCRS